MKRWGYMENGKFIPVPKQPIMLAGLSPPVTITIYNGKREIIEEPENAELQHKSVHPDGLP